jgi:hypothetical protein
VGIGIRSAATFVPNDPLSSTNTATCNAPAGVAERDVMFAVVARSPTASATTALTSSGWTVDSFTSANANAGPLAVLHRVATASEASTYTFTSASYTGTDAWFVAIVALTGVNNTSPVAAGPTVQDAGSASSSVVAPSVTVPAGMPAQALLVCAFIAVKFNATPNVYGWTPPSGMAEQVDLGANFIYGCVDTEAVDAGATGTNTAISITRSGGAATAPANPARAVSFAVRPDGSPPVFLSQYSSYH